MEDNQIVDLYWQRSDLAISETNQKYGRYCHTIAYNICGIAEDAEQKRMKDKTQINSNFRFC